MSSLAQDITLSQCDLQQKKLHLSSSQKYLYITVGLPAKVALADNLPKKTVRYPHREKIIFADFLNLTMHKL